MGVGGEAQPVAKITGNRAGLLALKEQVERALRAEEGMAVETTYRETDERRFDLFVQRAHRREQRWASRGSRSGPTTLGCSEGAVVRAPGLIGSRCY